MTCTVEGNPAAPIDPQRCGRISDRSRLPRTTLPTRAVPLSDHGVALAPDDRRPHRRPTGARHLRQRAARRALHRRRRPREREHRPHHGPCHLPLRAQSPGRPDQGDGADVASDLAFLNEWLLTPVSVLPTTRHHLAALEWNGERLFQAAKFGTEMQYQHLVFEEFARTVQPNVDRVLRADAGLRRRPRRFDRRGVRAHGLSLRPFDADRDGRPLRSPTSTSSATQAPSIPISSSG